MTSCNALVGDIFLSNILQNPSSVILDVSLTRIGENPQTTLFVALEYIDICGDPAGESFANMDVRKPPAGPETLLG